MPGGGRCPEHRRGGGASGKVGRMGVGELGCVGWGVRRDGLVRRASIPSRRRPRPRRRARARARARGRRRRSSGEGGGWGSGNWGASGALGWGVRWDGLVVRASWLGSLRVVRRARFVCSNSTFVRIALRRSTFRTPSAHEIDERGRFEHPEAASSPPTELLQTNRARARARARGRGRRRRSRGTARMGGGDFGESARGWRARSEWLRARSARPPWPGSPFPTRRQAGSSPEATKP